MSDLRDALAAAKTRLRLPELWRLLVLPGQPAKSCRCPWREDHKPSFSIFDDGLKWHDFGTNEGGDAVDFLGRVRGLNTADACREFLRLAGLADPAPLAPGPGLSRILDIYDYRDETGQLLFQVVRFEPKSFRQRRPDAASPDGWIWKLDGVRRVLYRLPETLAAVQRGETIFVAEGEKDVAALVACGLNATCNSAGAGKWLDEYTAALRDADVVIIADKDEAGRNHARLVAARLQGNARAVRILELPDFNGVPVKDAHDFFAAGATDADFQSALAAAQLYVAPTPAPVDLHAPAPVRVSQPTITLQEDEDDADDAPQPFPIECLPASLASIIAAAARCQRTPPALPAACALGVCSASIGAGLEVPSVHGGIARPNLFLLVSAESGSGKSQTFRAVAAPFLDHQARLLEDWRHKTGPKLQSDLSTAEAFLKKLTRQITRTTDPVERERLGAEKTFRTAERDELLRRAAMPAIIAQDVTTERLAALLRDNGETMFSACADARKLVDNLMGRYNPSGTTDESIYVAAYTGDFLKVDRKSLPEPIVLHQPCLAMLWLVQPDMLATMLGEQSLTDSGFLARCLTAHTLAMPQRIEGQSEGIPEAVRSQWANLINNLLATYHATAKPYRIEARPDARQALIDYYNEIVDRRSGDLADVGLFAARWAENGWRAGLVLHAALYGADAHNHSLEVETAQNAIRVVEWFSAQQLNILAKGRQQSAKKIEDEVLGLLDERTERQQLDYVTAKDVYRKRIVANAEIAHTLLARLEREGLLVGQDVKPQGGGKITRIFRRATQRNPVPE